MPAKKSNASAEGQTRIAEVLQKHFRAAGHSDFKCKRQYIVLWSKPTKGRPQGFPKPTDGNRFKISDCITWVESNVIKKGVEDDEDANLQQRAADAVARKKIRSDEEHKFDFEIKRGKYIAAREAEIDRLGVAKTILFIVREKIRAEFLKDDIQRGEKLIDQIDIGIEEASKA
jgi:hypothetical protein